MNIIDKRGLSSAYLSKDRLLWLDILNLVKLIYLILIDFNLFSVDYFDFDQFDAELFQFLLDHFKFEIF